MSGRQQKTTLAARVQDRMRNDILSGHYHPGKRLTFPDLCKRYGASVGVTREALASLREQGLVKTEAHQGYIVTPLSRDDLRELVAARLALEPIVLQRAILEGDVEWESHAVAAHHVLARAQRNQADGEITDEWASAHEAFHAALLGGCSNKRLLAMTSSLAEEAALYRRWCGSLEEGRDVAGEHSALLESAIERDSELAAERLRDHISLTAHFLLDGVFLQDAVTV
jgi:DNA-binding GntR family transcriptional regulator